MRWRNILIAGGILGGVVVAGVGLGAGAVGVEPARGCVDVQYVWARGSGQPFAEDYEGKRFKQAVDRRMRWNELAASYAVVDLDYPAIEVNPFAAVFAWLSAGYAGQYGASVLDGASALRVHVQREAERCPEMKFVLAGYSQGAHVLTESLGRLVEYVDRVLYVALLGEPRLYLPEGKQWLIGLAPEACKGAEGHSSYRLLVPNCYTHEGALSARDPYIPSQWEGNVGLVCNDIDFICGSSPVPVDNKGHVAYVQRLNMVAEVMAERVGEVFPDKLPIPNGRLDLDGLMGSGGDMDVAILINVQQATGRGYALGPYKQEARRLAERIFEAGGRVALVRYGQMYGDSTSVMCSFECSEEEFLAAMNMVKARNDASRFGALDGAAGLAYALDWRAGVPKAMVIMAAKGYEITGDEYVRISRGDDIKPREYLQITKGFRRADPISIYTVMPLPESDAGLMAEMAGENGGRHLQLGPFWGYDAESWAENVAEVGDAVGAVPMAMRGRSDARAMASGVDVGVASEVWGDLLTHMAGKPVAVLGLEEYWGGVGDTLWFDAALSYGEGAEIASYAWDFDGDGEYEVTGGGAVASWRYDEGFDGYAKVRVTDADGRAGTLSALVHVGSEVPEQEEAWRGEEVERVNEGDGGGADDGGERGTEVGGVAGGEEGGRGAGVGETAGGGTGGLDGVEVPNAGVLAVSGGNGGLSVFTVGLVALVGVCVGFVRSLVAWWRDNQKVAPDISA